MKKIDDSFIAGHFTQKALTKDGCDIQYWISGNNSGRWLILLHGACADHRMFYYQLPLVYEHFKVLLWDARGHGLSRPASRYSAGLLISDLAALMEKEHCPKATLIGQSAGGNLAQAMAYQYPEKVESLVIIGSTWNAQKLSFIDRWALKAAPALMALSPWKLLLEQSTKNSSMKPEIRAYLKESFADLGKKEFIRNFGGIIDFLHEDEGRRINKNILLIVGESDRTGNIRKIAPSFAAAEPYCSYHIIKNAGHTANMDNPDDFNRLLLGFLEKQYSREN